MPRFLWMASLYMMAGCAPEGAAPEPDPPPAADPPPVEQAPAPGPTINERPLLALDGEGLRLVTPSSGSSRPLPFGTPQSRAVRALTTVFGTDPVEEGEAADCGADYARWVEGLTVWFDRERLVGWAVREGSGLTTLDGWGPGSTRAELEETRTLTVERSSLGVEFTAGGMAGLLESGAADARIQNLWAGHACLAR